MKPQSAAWALDGSDASPHPLGMPPADKPPNKPPSDRETKLAQALRANLRRRKAAGPTPLSKPAAKNNGDG